MGFLAALAPALLQTGVGFLQNRSAKKDRKKELKQAEKRAALTRLVESLGGEAGAATQQIQQPGNPFLGALGDLTSDPLVRNQLSALIEDLLKGGNPSSLLNALPGGAGGGGPRQQSFFEGPR